MSCKDSFIVDRKASLLCECWSIRTELCVCVCVHLLSLSCLSREPTSWGYADKVSPFFNSTRRITTSSPLVNTIFHVLLCFGQSSKLATSSRRTWTSSFEDTSMWSEAQSKATTFIKEGNSSARMPFFFDVTIVEK